MGQGNTEDQPGTIKQEASTYAWNVPSFAVAFQSIQEISKEEDRPASRPHTRTRVKYGVRLLLKKITTSLTPGFDTIL